MHHQSKSLMATAKQFIARTFKTGETMRTGIEPNAVGNEVLDENQVKIEVLLNSSGQPPSEFRIFKAGANDTSKGVFNLSADGIMSCLDCAQKHGNELCVDYDHAMFSALAVDPAQAKKAAGWFKLAQKDGDLWAVDVRWTPKATEMLASREYRYISPAFKSINGEITEVINVALTNLPATHNLTPLMASQTHTEEEDMKTLLTALHVEAEADALSKIAALQEAEVSLLSACEVKTTSEALGKVMAWKSAAAQFEKLSQDMAELKAAQHKAAVEAIVGEAVKSGKATPAQSEVLLSMGMKDIDMLKAFVDASPVLAPAEKTQGDANKTAIHLSQEAVEIARMFGNDPKSLAGAEVRVADEIETNK